MWAQAFRARRGGAHPVRLHPVSVLGDPGPAHRSPARGALVIRFRHGDPLGALAFFIAKYTPVRTQVIAAYAIAWLLLLSGIRVIIDHGLRAQDAKILRDATHIPRLIWSGLWLAGALAALFIGGRMLVMPA